MIRKVEIIDVETNECIAETDLLFVKGRGAWGDIVHLGDNKNSFKLEFDIAAWCKGDRH